MKVNAKGEVKLAKNETRIGEFVISKEEAHYKLRTTSGNWSMRVGENTAIFGMIKASLATGETKLLRGWAVVMYNTSLVVPDPDFLETINNASNECFLRHKDVYGMGDISDEEDQQIIAAMKEEREMIDKMKKEQEQENEN